MFIRVTAALTLSRRSLLVFPLVAFVAAAQQPASNWENLKTVAPGTQVRVVSGTSLKPIQGRLGSVTDTDLVLGRGASQQSFLRPQVSGVFVEKSHHRLRNALIGLGVGTGAGLLIGFGVGHAQESGCRKSGGWFCGLDAGVETGVGGVAGLLGGSLLGAFWPTGGWRKIYAP
jgi:hypothetical protein